MEILSIDNRSETDDDAHGYIIFSDLARLSFTLFPSKKGETHWELVEPGTTTWPPVTDAHRELALAHLKEHGAKMPEAAPEEPLAA